MNAQSDEARFFARLSQSLMSDRQETPTFEHVVRSAVEVVPPCDWAGISLRTRHGITTAASTDPLVDDCDDAQYALDEGPCLEAAQYADYFVSDELATDARWPLWREHALAAGVQSVVSVRLQTEDEAIGALNFYAGRAGAWTQDDVDLALVFSAHATNALISARLVTGLTTTLNRRHTIGIAEGMLVAAHGLDVQQAFEVLHALARDHSLPLHRVAELIVEERGLPAVLAAGLEGA